MLSSSRNSSEKAFLDDSDEEAEEVQTILAQHLLGNIFVLRLRPSSFVREILLEMSNSYMQVELAKHKLIEAIVSRG